MRAVAAVFFMLLPSRAAWADEPPRLYAVIVGVNASPRESLRPLRFADDDAARYHELLSAYADDVTLLATIDDETQRQHRGLAGRARPPTRERLDATVARLRELVLSDRAQDRRAELIVAYAGHGFMDDAGEPALALEGGALGREALVRDVVQAVGADRTHLVLDACHAADIVGARGDWQDDTAPVDHAGLVRAWVAGSRIESLPTVGYVVSGSADQETHEWSVYRAGVFSHEVVSGLLGAADVNGDGRIEYSELGAFLAAANAAVDDPRARLSVRVRAPPADRTSPLVDLGRSRFRHALHLGTDRAGRFHLEDARGVRYADFHKERGSDMAVALAPSAFYYLRSEDSGDEARLELGSFPVVSADRLRWSRIEMAARGSVSESFRRGLFATAYGPSFFQGHAAATGEIPLGPEPAERWMRQEAPSESAPPTRPTARPARRPRPERLPEPPRRAGSPSRALRTWGWIGVGTAGALAAGAGVAGVLTLDARSDFEDRVRSTGAADETIADRTRQRGVATTVLGGAALGVAALGVTLLLLDGGDEDGPRVSAGPGTIRLHASF